MALASTAPDSTLVEELRKLSIEIHLNPRAKIRIIADWYETANKLHGHERAEMGMLLLGIINAREDPGGQVTINQIGSPGAVINLGEVLGSIHTSVQTMSALGEPQRQFAEAIEQLAAAIAGSALDEPAKKDALQVVEEIATQAQTPAEKRSQGVVKTLLEGLPRMIATVTAAVELWEKLGPIVKAYLGL